jgi:hypothetical protein
MKKLLLFLPVIAVTLLWSSWQKPVEHRSMINKEEVISCMNSETIEAYLQEGLILNHIFSRMSSHVWSGHALTITICPGHLVHRKGKMSWRNDNGDGGAWNSISLGTWK